MKMLKWSQLILGSENTAVLLMYYFFSMGQLLFDGFRTSEN